MNVRLFSHLSIKVTIHLFFLVRWPIEDTHFNATFNPKPEAPSWLLFHPQAELHPLQLLSHIKVNSPSSPSLPALHKQPISLHCNIPVMGTIPPCLCDPSKTVALELHADFLTHHVYSPYCMHYYTGTQIH